MKNNNTNLITAIFCAVFFLVSLAATIMKFTVWNLTYTLVFAFGAALCAIAYFYNRKYIASTSQKESNLITGIFCGVMSIVAIIACISQLTVWNVAYAIIFALGCLLCIYVYLDNR